MTLYISYFKPFFVVVVSCIMYYTKLKYHLFDNNICAISLYKFITIGICLRYFEQMYE